MLTHATVFEDKALADEAVAAVEKVVNNDALDRLSADRKGTTAETKESVV